MATAAHTPRFDGELLLRLVGSAPRWLSWVLIVLLGVRAALFVGQLAGTSAGDLPGTEPPPPVVTRNVVDVPSILRSNLFGQAASARGALDAPVTSMPLQLAGVIADIDEKKGFAMLGSSPADIKFYRVGEAVPGGALLHAVFVDRVLLDRGGQIEALLLPARPAVGMASPPAQMPPTASTSVANVRQIIRDNPNIINQVMRRTAVFADGRLQGIRVYPGTNSQAFSKLGLRAGDLVTAINGSTLDDQTRSEAIFSTLSNSAEARITVVRNGTPQDLLLNLADISDEASRLADTPAPPPEATSAPGDQPPAGPESAR